MEIRTPKTPLGFSVVGFTETQIPQIASIITRKNTTQGSEND